jgi:hypothetical protein
MIYLNTRNHHRAGEASRKWPFFCPICFILPPRLGKLKLGTGLFWHSPIPIVVLLKYRPLPVFPGNVAEY